MWRAAARVVRKLVRRPLTTGASRSATDISASGVPCTSPCWITLSDTSMPPDEEATAAAWASTAPSFSASTTAVSADPPLARMSSATASSGGAVRPVRCTVAPSRAKARPTAPPIDPPPP